jgi:hypothetical protein
MDWWIDESPPTPQYTSNEPALISHYGTAIRQDDFQKTRYTFEGVREDKEDQFSLGQEAFFQGTHVGFIVNIEREYTSTQDFPSVNIETEVSHKELTIGQAAWSPRRFQQPHYK